MVTMIYSGEHGGINISEKMGVQGMDILLYPAIKFYT